MYKRPALNPGLSLKPSLLDDHLLIPFILSFPLLWSVTDHYLPTPTIHQLLLIPNKIGDLSLTDPFPKWKGPFKIILGTPTATKLEGLLIRFTYPTSNPFTPPPGNNSLHTYQPQEEPAPLSFRGHRSTACPRRIRPHASNCAQLCWTEHGFFFPPHPLVCFCSG